MASVSTHPSTDDVKHFGSQASWNTPVVRELLGCLVLTWSEDRGQMLQSIAEDESWQSKVCDDVQDFLRSVFQLDVPLTVVDLPQRSTASYEQLREMATRTSELNRSLLLICGAVDDGEEEQWARQIGVWAYLPGTSSLQGLRLMFAEARKAVARQSTAYFEASGYR